MRNFHVMIFWIHWQIIHFYQYVLPWEKLFQILFDFLLNWHLLRKSWRRRSSVRRFIFFKHLPLRIKMYFRAETVHLKGQFQLMFNWSFFSLPQYIFFAPLCSEVDFTGDHWNYELGETRRGSFVKWLIILCVYFIWVNCELPQTSL